MPDKLNLVTNVYKRRCGNPKPKMNRLILVCTGIFLMCTIVWYLRLPYTNKEILNYSFRFSSYGRYVIHCKNCIFASESICSHF